MRLMGTVLQVLRRDEDTAETVVRLGPPHAPQNRLRVEEQATMVAYSATGWLVGETLECEGEWGAHPRFGKAFRATQVTRRTPLSAEEEAQFVASNVPRLGVKRARVGLEKLGGLAALVEDAKTNPARVREAFGEAFGGKLLAVDWGGVDVPADLHAQLKAAGMRIMRMRRVLEHFGPEGTRALMATQPYRLCEVPGLGFQTAEAVAQVVATARGQARNPLDAERLLHGLVWVLGQERGNGHTCMPMDDALAVAMRRLRLDRNGHSDKLLREAIQRAKDQRLVVEEFDHLYSTFLWKVEHEAADHLRRILGHPVDASPVLQETVEQYVARTDLSDEQRRAVVQLLGGRVGILTGGPGVGKTRTVASLVKVAQQMSKTLRLLAPTGKAAQRLTAMTGLQAETLHRAMQLGVADADDDASAAVPAHRRSRGAPVPVIGPRYFDEDIVIVDEAGMLELSLFRELVSRIRSKRTQLILVGDGAQLPPIGAGQPFLDLLAAAAVPVARLQKVWRQSEASANAIIDGAYAINNGRLPAFAREGTGVRLFDPRAHASWPAQADIASRDAWEVRTVLSWLVGAAQKYADLLGIDPVRDVQVLSPMVVGPLGATAINTALQQALNPDGREVGKIQLGEGDYRSGVRLGDKVIQRKNDYRREVFNGELGYVVAATSDGMSIEVRFEDHPETTVVYRGREETKQLSLAYAYSIHKAQGSEAPVVFLPVHDMHRVLLSRPVLYTGWTRAKSAVAVFGPVTALERGIQQQSTGIRYGFFRQRLEAALAEHRALMQRRGQRPA